MAISYEDMLKLGVEQLEKGRTLNQLGADYIKLGANKKDITRALNEIKDYRTKTTAKAKREMNSVIKSEAQNEPEKDQPKSNTQTKSKSLLWLYILAFLILAGAAYYLYYNGLLDFSF